MKAGLKLGVIGCGRWGKNHARTLAQMGVLAAVADAHVPARDAVAADFGVASLTPDQMIAAPEISAIVVVLPPDQQAAMALRVLAAGKHAMIERPMAMTAQDARAIAHAATAAQVTAMTGHLLLFHPAYLAIADVLRAGRLGDLRHIRTERAGYGSFFPNTDVAWDLLPHDLSMILDLMGELPANRQMQGRAIVTDRADVASLQMRYDTGVMVDCFASRIAPVRSRYLVLQGTKASVIWNDLEPDWGRKVLLVDHTPGRATAHDPQPIPLVESMALEAELRHFVDSISHATPARANVQDAAQIITYLAETPAT